MVYAILCLYHLLPLGIGRVGKTETKRKGKVLIWMNWLRKLLSCGLALAIFLGSASGLSALPDIGVTASAASVREPYFENYRDGTYSNPSRFTNQLPYKVYYPAGYDPEEADYNPALPEIPVVLFLHGHGAQLNEEHSNIGAQLGTAFPWIYQMADPTDDKDRMFYENYPCVVVAPQCVGYEYAGPYNQWVAAPFQPGEYDIAQTPETVYLAMAAELTDQIASQPNVDERRQYVTGLSMGGYGTWDIIARHPGQFAAAIPLCGGADARTAEWLEDVSIWAFHGTADTMIYPTGTEAMADYLSRNSRRFKCTLMEGRNHYIWDDACRFVDASGQNPIAWMFEQESSRYGDKSALKEAYTEAVNLQVIAPDENAVYTFYQTAADAREVLEDPRATQIEIDNALTSLRIGMLLLNPAGNREGWFVDMMHTFYYVDNKPVVGWREIDGARYYFAPTSGVMVQGEWYIDGKPYYFDPATGQMQTGLRRINGSLYYLTDFEPRRGWFEENGSWYFASSNDRLATGWTTLGRQYFFDRETGKMKTGWIQYDYKGYGVVWFYLGTDGAMRTGWYQVGSKWYYSDKYGVMMTGWQKINGKWYLFAGSGAMKTGWQKVGGKWYYFGSDGAMRTGWTKVGKKWYLLSGSGVMRTGWAKVSGKWYYLESTGAMRTGWVKAGGKWYFCDGSGRMLASTSKRLGKKTYRFGASGVCLNP